MCAKINPKVSDVRQCSQSVSEKDNQVYHQAIRKVNEQSTRPGDAGKMLDISRSLGKRLTR